MSSVVITSMHDSGVADRGEHLVLHVLPPLGAVGADRVGVRQVVDQRDAGRAGDRGVHVELAAGAATVRHLQRRHDLELREQRLDRRAAVGLDQGRHDVGAPGGPPAPLVEHGVGLPHPGRRAEVDAQPPAALPLGTVGHDAIVTAPPGGRLRRDPTHVILTQP